MRFTLSEALLAELRRQQKQRGDSDDLTVEHDAFLLDPGLGPASYLTSDGRVLVDARYRFEDEKTVRGATAEEAIVALVVGAKKTGVMRVLATNEPAIRCYRRSGFVEVRREPAKDLPPVRPPEDDVVMRWAEADKRR